MKAFILILLLVLFSLACGQKTGPEEDTGASPDQEYGYWEIDDYSEFDVRTDPWPPVSDTPVKLIAEVKYLYGEGDEYYDGTVAYNVASQEKEDLSWSSMNEVKREDGVVTFEATVTFPKGEKYIQFLLDIPGYDEPQRFTGWKVKIK